MSQNGNGSGKSRLPYLEIKNWNRYQVLKNGRSAPWLKLYKSLQHDPFFAELRCFETGVWCKLLLYRLEIGRNLDNNLPFIARHLCPGASRRHDAGNTVKCLTMLKRFGALIETTDRGVGQTTAIGRSDDGYRSVRQGRDTIVETNQQVTGNLGAREGSSCFEDLERESKPPLTPPSAKGGTPAMQAGKGNGKGELEAWMREMHPELATWPGSTTKRGNHQTG